MRATEPAVSGQREKAKLLDVNMHPSTTNTREVYRVAVITQSRTLQLPLSEEFPEWMAAEQTVIFQLPGLLLHMPLKRLLGNYGPYKMHSSIRQFSFNQL